MVVRGRLPAVRVWNSPVDKQSILFKRTDNRTCTCWTMWQKLNGPVLVERGDPQVRRTGRLHGGGEKIWPMDGEEDGKHTVEEDVVGDIIKPSLVTSGSFILAL